MTRQAIRLQGQDHFAVTHPSSSHLVVNWLSCGNRRIRCTVPLWILSSLTAYNCGTTSERDILYAVYNNVTVSVQ
ncbi:hypothetical protein J6590_106070, partial [Homalodisca vitripennis]